MALEHRTTHAAPGAPRETKGDLTALLDHVRENPVLYVAAAAFLVLCAVVGVAFRAYRTEAEQTGVTAYARALDAELPAARAAALRELPGGPDWLKAESAYMAGEAAFAAAEFDEAKTLFEQLRVVHPDYEFTPDAVEGLGFIAEEQKEYDAAIAQYENIGEVWPDSFAARRQPLNIARAQEAAGNIEAAVAAYREQLDVFPGSNAALYAQQALNRLRETQPHLFPEETPVMDEAATGLESPLELDLNIPPTPGAAAPEGETAEGDDQAESTPGDAAEGAPVTPEDETGADDASADVVDESPAEAVTPDAAVATPDTAAPEEAPAADAPEEPAEGTEQPSPEPADPTPNS